MLLLRLRRKENLPPLLLRLAGRVLGETKPEHGHKLIEYFRALSKPFIV